jgi:hypothetical protein
LFIYLQKRLRRARIIDHLRDGKDPLIKKFTKDELRPIMDDNRYHSPEESETDSEQPRSERKIVIKDIGWRSSTVSFFITFLFYI